MLGRKERGQLELFITGSLRQLVPGDHILARVDRVLDLSWLRDEVAELYCADNGRPGIDPEVAVRLMLAGLLLGDGAQEEPPERQFRYDARHDIAKCPRGKVLRPGRPIAHGRFFYSRARDCSRCSMASLYLSKGRLNKVLVISNEHPALLRARRRRERWSDEDQRLCQRHRWRSEGFHGEAKTWHGLARAVRRGLQNMRIQAFLTAVAVNLKRLAAALCALFWSILSVLRGRGRLLEPEPRPNAGI